MKKIDISDIPFKLLYEGYYWYSNKSKPEILNNQPFSLDKFSSLPFIVEGNLYNAETGTSVSIKCIDGEYAIFTTNLKDLPANQTVEQKYIAHDLKDIDKIVLVEFWQESEADELLENMTTLVPAWTAFKGFTN